MNQKPEQKKKKKTEKILTRQILSIFFFFLTWGVSLAKVRNQIMEIIICPNESFLLWFK